MTEKFYRSAIILVFILGAVYFFKPVVQRYEIAETDAGTFLLDTKSGTTWRRVVIMSSNNKDLLTSHWSTDQRFDDPEEENRFTNYIKSLDKSGAANKKNSAN